MRVYQNRIEGSGLVGDVIGTVVNKSIDLLPFEAHLPFYRFCGPGRKLTKRLQRGDQGINKLDEACKQHDIIYSKYSYSENRSRADKDLADNSWERVKANDASLAKKAAAWTVTNIMKANTKFGRGSLKKKKNQLLNEL